MSATTTMRKLTTKTSVERLTEAEVLAEIREGQGDLSLRDYADRIGVSHSYLSNILNDPPKRSPGRTVLKHFNIGKKRKTVVVYEFFRTK